MAVRARRTCLMKTNRNEKFHIAVLLMCTYMCRLWKNYFFAEPAVWMFQGLVLKSHAILVDHICNDIAAFIGKWKPVLRNRIHRDPYSFYLLDPGSDPGGKICKIISYLLLFCFSKRKVSNLTLCDCREIFITCFNTWKIPLVLFWRSPDLEPYCIVFKSTLPVNWYL